MVILGIHFGHDASLCLTKGNKLISAISKERVTRVKFDDGFFDLDELLQITKTKPSEITAVAFAGRFNSNRWYDAIKNFEASKSTLSPLHHIRKKLAYLYFSFEGSKFLLSTNRRLAGKVIQEEIRKYLSKKGISKKVHFIDHHTCHAASAYYTAGWKDALVVTADGSGDLISATVFTGKNGKLSQVHAESSLEVSGGEFYRTITEKLGFKGNRHEGKITGLAAFGDPKKAYDLIIPLLRFDKKSGSLTSDVDQYLNFQGKMRGFVGGILWKYKAYIDQKFDPSITKEDYAAAFQQRLEDVFVEYVTHYVKKTGMKKVCLAGGVFSNVKLNQRILEIKGVENVFVFPAMGDSGIAAGAALFLNASLQKHPLPQELEHVYLGHGYTDKEILDELKRHKTLTYKKVENVEELTARMVADGVIVGRFHGQMEYGPRALGNRTILADPRDRHINDTLNKRLRRTEFMPFAPSILEEYSHEWFKGWKIDHPAARFMTITYDVVEDKRDLAPAVVHVDGTARPQTVSKSVNPSYWKIIDEFRKITGLPIVINTSFNIHEEPIVCSPYDAVRSLKENAVDVLSIGNYLVEIRSKKNSFLAKYA